MQNLWPRWTLNTLYVVRVVNEHNFAVNKKGGCNLTRSKFGNSWQSCWKAAKFAAGWTVTRLQVVAYAYVVILAIYYTAASSSLPTEDTLQE